MECVQLRTVDDSVLVSKEHFLAVLKRIHHHSPRITQFDLKDRLVVLAPPLFTCACMVFAKFEKMTKDWDSARDLWQAFDIWDISGEGTLFEVSG